jgi:hypothetical protein
MSVCSQCGCALPGLEHLCEKCYEAKYPELGQPKSFLESTWFGLCYVICGMGLTWGLVLELSSGQSKPDHQYFYFVGWAVLTLFRLRWHAIRNKGTVKTRQRRLPDWCLVVFCILIGLPFNWACAFLWFSRRYAFFSGPVVSLTLLIVALSAAIGLLVRLTGGNWRTALQVFAVASCVPSAIALGLGFLR